MSYQAMERHGEILNAYHQVIKDDLKSLYTDHNYDILEKVILWRNYNQWFPLVGVRAPQAEQRGFLGR